MNELLEQFLSEAREALQGIADMLMKLESAPADDDLMTQLFRLVHTLKGNSGLFEFPEMTRVLHAGEDLMDAVRHGRVDYSQALADRLLDAMDFVGMLCDDIESGASQGSAHADDAQRLAAALRTLIGTSAEAQAGEGTAAAGQSLSDEQRRALILSIPEAQRLQVFGTAVAAGLARPLHLLVYRPDEECFFQGDDPLFRAMQSPGLQWGAIRERGPWPALSSLDVFRCVLDFELLSDASAAELDEHYRYVPEQRCISAISAWELVQPAGQTADGAPDAALLTEAQALLVVQDLAGLESLVNARLDCSDPGLWLASALRWMQCVLTAAPKEASTPRALRVLIEALRTMAPIDWSEAAEPSAVAPVAPGPAVTLAELPVDENALQALIQLVETQREILSLPDDAKWLGGRIKAAAKVLSGCLVAAGRTAMRPALQAAAAAALAEGRSAPLADWLEQAFPEEEELSSCRTEEAAVEVGVADAATLETLPSALPDNDPPMTAVAAAVVGDAGDADVRFGRRSEDQQSARSLKVDQVKIDRLMNLIGEMVVAKNAIPYLANRAETVFGVRDLAREIKAQYAVINRISEEMQDAIMQVRMMPVSFIFQRFPRLVRDTSRRLGKEVNLVLEGQDTAADKNIIESLGDPLVHIVRNSLDHGLESPEDRRAVGKPVVGTLKIQARQESDRVVIEISDDGRGIDPQVIKRKAYEKGLIDELAVDRLSDQEAIQLIFAPGFSTAEVISDLSGRGVGMDVVRTAIERVNGSIALDSVKGRGTRIRLSLPLSMAVTNVMTIQADGQTFGVPMDVVVETVRVPRSSVRQIKQSMATLLRGKVVPLKSLNSLLGLAAPPLCNDNDELAVLVVRVGEDTLGLLVDDFLETADIILKPLAGVLGGMKAYSGSALMGDGSVLMVLNVKEVL